MRYVKQLAILNLVTFIFAFVLSMLGQTAVVGVYTMAEMSAKYESGITPANFAFSIWPLIYLALAAMLIYHLVQAFKQNETYITNKEIVVIGLMFAINQLAISAWIYTWLNDLPGVSCLLLLVQWYTLYCIDRRLQLLNPKKGKTSLFITQLPLSLYFGWITVATLTNFAAWLVSLGWLTNIQINLYVSYTLLMVTIGIGAVVVYFKHNIFYGLVIIWAIYGVIMKQLEMGNEAFQSLVYLGSFGIIIVLLVLIKTTVAYSSVEEKPYRKRKKAIPY
ncbi:tryptophan-rich sensory protein [Olivibacter ginsenosidimutans]|uniref:Tryptophan-rich sensory protein n=1 Tax=Olivibacter ginsenosidimutans TaxID=1176537 RepID=A0ABP9B764_9SPHI